MLHRWGGLGTIGEFWRVFSELSPELVREESERPFRLAVVGGRGSGKTTLAVALSGGPSARAQTADVLVEVADSAPEEGGSVRRAGAMEGPDSPVSVAPPCVPPLPLADLYCYIIDAAQGITPRDVSALDGMVKRRSALLVLVNKIDLLPDHDALRSKSYAALSSVAVTRVAFGSGTHPEDVSGAFARALLQALPDKRLALARRLPSLRRAVADDLIAETARVNAEFALLSNIPANLPIVGGLLGGGADLLVLTKNQAMLLLKLAAINDRDLRSKRTLAAEIVPVVGAAFVWRTIARELIGLLPSIVAAVPKAAVGYIGTYVVGQMAHYYYASGVRPTGDIARRFSQEAIGRWRSIRLESGRTRVPLLAHRPTERGPGSD